MDGDVLALEGAVTMLTAPEFSASLDAEIARLKPRHIDFTGVTDLDSTAVALVLQVARAVGSQVPVVGAPPGFAKLAALYGVDSLLASN